MAGVIANAAAAAVPKPPSGLGKQGLGKQVVQFRQLRQNSSEITQAPTMYPDGDSLADTIIKAISRKQSATEAQSPIKSSNSHSPSGSGETQPSVAVIGTDLINCEPEDVESGGSE